MTPESGSPHESGGSGSADVAEAARPADREGSPALYRWPAEWETHAATWLSWPHNRDTWPDRMERVEEAFTRIVASLCDGERVRINMQDAAMAERVARRLEGAGVPVASRVDLLPIPTDDAWVRDHGPIFLERRAQPVSERAGDLGPERRDAPEVVAAARAGDPLLLLDFRFDAWGGKYPPWDRDAAVPERIAALRGLPRVARDEVLEAGAIDGNGAGTCLTTESCLLHPNRGRGRTRGAMEELLAETLGVRKVLWLGDGIVGDDTDGHVDDLTRFVSPTTVVSAIEEDESDANHRALAENWRRLASMSDATGRRLARVALPMPRPVVIDGVRCPASYANFYIGNRVVLVPAFDDPADERAAEILAEQWPEREIVPIPCRDLVQGLGTLHCLTQQEPAV